MRVNSLAFRLFAAAAAWSLLVLPVAALVLVSLYREAVERSFDARLNVYLTNLVATRAAAAASGAQATPDLGEPLFNLPFSGWYWQIKPLTAGATPLQASESLLDQKLALPSEAGVAASANQIRQAYIDGPERQRLRVLERRITLDGGGGKTQYSYAVAGDSAEIESDISEFTTLLAAALTVLGVGLVVATLFQVRYGLRPLRAIRRGLAAIRSGESERLEGDYPVEIVPLQDELNALIRSNHDIVERARTHVGNLAHALKTPLSVITNEARDDEGVLAVKVVEQADVMRTQITHHLDRARMAARSGVIAGVTEITPVLEALVRALARIHEDRGLMLRLDSPEGLKFQGEKQDLEEMVGNLLDNACKWAQSEVVLSVLAEGESGDEEGPSLVFQVDDDGPGLSEAERAAAVERGQRLDESKPGSGLGLSIVADLAHLYKGGFSLDVSPQGGVRARLQLPAA